MALAVMPVFLSSEADALFMKHFLLGDAQPMRIQGTSRAGEPMQVDAQHVFVAGFEIRDDMVRDWTLVWDD